MKTLIFIVATLAYYTQIKCMLWTAKREDFEGIFCSVSYFVFYNLAYCVTLSHFNSVKVVYAAVVSP